MLRRAATYVKSNAVAFLALFLALGTGGAYAANTIATGDIIDNQVTSADVRDDTLGFGGLAKQDLGPGSVGSSEVGDFTLGNGDFLTGSVDGRVITDGGLKDEDVGESFLVNFVGTIGVVPASSCQIRTVSGVPGSVRGNHLVLTASNADAAPGLIYSAEYTLTTFTDFFIKVCNPTTSSIDDGNTHFNLLSIEAQ